MDLLIVEPIETEVLHWLQARHSVLYAPDLASDARGLRHALSEARAAILPAQARIDAATLTSAPTLEAIGRIDPALDNIDLEACAQAAIELVRGSAATAPAEAEFMIGAMINSLRPGSTGSRAAVGRELASATVGLIGLAPAARSLSAMLSGFGSRLLGYDPAVHSSDALWGRWRIEPMGLRDLLQTADAVCLQLPYYSRYQGLLGERYLPNCKPGLVLISTSHSALFDEAALATALISGRVASVWLDSVEPGLFDAGRPLHDVPNVHTTSRLAGYTQESRTRSVWSVAQRLHEILIDAPTGTGGSYGVSSPIPLHGPVSEPGPLHQPRVREAQDTVPSELADTVPGEIDGQEAWALLRALEQDAAATRDGGDHGTVAEPGDAVLNPAVRADPKAGPASR